MQEVTFAEAGVKERADLQRVLRDKIDVISPDTLIIAEEYGDWLDSHRRIDLLGIDCDARLVVIELKRTEDGGHMELQALRYAAMVARMTFAKAVDVYARYLKKPREEANTRLLEFLDWDEPLQEAFANDVRIVLAAADFSKEVTTAVLWLNERELDIRCVRLKPYRLSDRLLIDAQQVIPLPEATDYQVQLREKAEEVRSAGNSSRDFTRIRPRHSRAVPSAPHEARRHPRVGEGSDQHRQAAGGHGPAPTPRQFTLHLG